MGIFIRIPTTAVVTWYGGSRSSTRRSHVEGPLSGVACDIGVSPPAVSCWRFRSDGQRRRPAAGIDVVATVAGDAWVLEGAVGCMGKRELPLLAASDGRLFFFGLGWLVSFFFVSVCLCFCFVFLV